MERERREDMRGERLVVSVHSREYEVRRLHLSVLHNWIVMPCTAIYSGTRNGGYSQSSNTLPSPSLLKVNFYIFLYITFYKSHQKSLFGAEKVLGLLFCCTSFEVLDFHQLWAELV